MNSVQEYWLKKLAGLRIGSQGTAPHKPLLLLVLLDRAEQDVITRRTVLTPELSFEFDTYSQIVTHRRNQRPDVRLPFHHLMNDGLGVPLDQHGELSPHRSVTSQVELDEQFLQLARDPSFRDAARQLLIQKYFEPAEHHALAAMIGMTWTDAELATEHVEIENAVRTGRGARFRLDIVSAYNYACALTGYRVTTIGGGSIVDAAHIHQFARSRNDDPTNGIALSKNAHWLFDIGLWTISDAYTVIVAKTAFDESSPNQVSLCEFNGSKIQLPHDPSIWPAPRHLAWHRRNVFVAG